MNAGNAPADATLSEAQLRQTLLEYQAILDNALVGIVFTRNRKFLHCNQHFAEIFGWSIEELAGKSTHLVYPSTDAFEEMARIAIPILGSGQRLDIETEMKRRDGSTFLCRILAKAIDPTDTAKGTIFIAEDVTERRRIESEREKAQERVLYMAHYDSLTGLPNRHLLQDRLKQLVAQAHRGLLRVAVLFIDLDYFKHINDSLGHQVGDRLLQSISDNLQLCLREGDSVARIGGDEFVVSLLLSNCSNEAALVAQKVLNVLKQDFMIDDHELHVSASIGISLYPEDGCSVDELMRAADIAMYHAKESGRNNYQFFTPALNVSAQRRLEVARDLRRALSRNQLVLHFQPQVDIQTGRIVSAEALLRFSQPDTKTLVSCGSFISVAEETGLILPIGEWALRHACSQLKEWRKAGHIALRMAVNLSPRQFYQPDLSQMVRQILEETDLPSDALELEITESLLLQRSEANVEVLRDLGNMGIRLSIDDFGTGFSNLGYLQRFPVHALKIDQSFIRGIGKNQNDTALVRAIVAMAHSLRLQILAEGVETEHQVRFLLACGCTVAQGFYYSKPLPAESFRDLLDGPAAILSPALV